MLFRKRDVRTQRKRRRRSGKLQNIVIPTPATQCIQGGQWRWAASCETGCRDGFRITVGFDVFCITVVRETKIYGILHNI